MTVNLTISGSSFDSALGDTIDLGTSVSPGSDTDFQDLFISHDAEVAAITGCAFYVTEYTGSNYLGSNTADDLVELLGWGDGGDGIKVVQDGWGSWTIGTENTTGTWEIIANGNGDTDNEIGLSTDAVTTGTPAAAGEIPVGGEAHLQVKVDVPNPSGGAGYRAFSLVFEYSATS